MTSVQTPLVNRLIGLQTQLNRLDERLEFKANIAAPVGYRTADRLGSVAATLRRLADEFQTTAPEHSTLIRRLNEDAIATAIDAGRLTSMASEGYTYASYWGTVLDRPIANVQAAIEVLLAGARVALPKPGSTP